MLFYGNWFDRRIAQLLHFLMVNPWTKVTGRSHLHLTMALWYATWPCLAWGFIGTVIALTTGPNFLGVFGNLLGGVSLGITTALLGFLQMFFVAEMNLFRREVLHCIRTQAMTLRLVVMAAYQCRLRQALLVLTAVAWVFEPQWALGLLLITLQRYAITDIHFGGGKGVWGRAVDQVRSMNLGVNVQSA